MKQSRIYFSKKNLSIYYADGKIISHKVHFYFVIFVIK